MDRLTKHELKEYYWLRKNIEQLENKLLELETEATRQTTLFTQEPKGNILYKDKLSSLVAEIVTVKEEINRQLQRSYSLMAKIEKAIEKLPEREKYLIRARYIELKTWEQIAVDMNYSWRQVHNIHSHALALLAQDDVAQDCTLLHSVS